MGLAAARAHQLLGFKVRLVHARLQAPVHMHVRRVDWQRENNEWDWVTEVLGGEEITAQSWLPTEDNIQERAYGAFCAALKTTTATTSFSSSLLEKCLKGVQDALLVRKASRSGL